MAKRIFKNIAICLFILFFNSSICVDMLREADCELKMVFTVNNKSSSDLILKFFIYDDEEYLLFFPDTLNTVSLLKDSCYTDSFHYHQIDPTTSTCYFDYHLDNVVKMKVFSDTTLVNIFSVRPNCDICINKIDCDTFPEKELFIHYDTLVLDTL